MRDDMPRGSGGEATVLGQLISCLRRVCEPNFVLFAEEYCHNRFSLVNLQPVIRENPDAPV